MAELTTGKFFEVAFISVIPAGVLSAVLHCFVFPLVFIMTHDCGRWFCDHNYPFEWSVYWAIFGLAYLFIMIIGIVAETSEQQSGPVRRNSGSSDSFGGGRETDYYDSDMEGSSGYYGGGW